MKHLVLIILLLSALPKSSLADSAEHVSLLYCDEANSKFMVRFGILWNDSPTTETELKAIPDNISEETNLFKFEGRNCILKDGKKISLKDKRGQAFAYGQGGGDPDTYFSLKIDNKNIYFNKTFYQGRAYSSYIITGVYYDGVTLQECRVTDQETYKEYGLGKEIVPSAVKCEDVSYRLNGKSLAGEEEESFSNESLKLKLEESLSQECREMAKVDYTSFPSDTQPSDIDINNDGKVDKVFQIAGSSGYFDGSYLFAFVNNLDKATEFSEYDKRDAPPFEKLKNIVYDDTWGAYFISINQTGSSPRYISNDLFIYKGKTYINTNETNRERIPSQTISEILPNNSVKILCEFP